MRALQPSARVDDLEALQELATQVRRDSLRMITAAGSGHPGGALGCADFLVALYFHHLVRGEGFQLDGEGEDVFLLSNGHISAAWYSVLARSGHFPLQELSTFRRLHSRLQGHPTPAKGLPGVRVASGSLGQGLSVGLGMALAKRAKGDPHRVYTLHGDGELQEGQIWEAMLYAGARGVDNLIATIDYNNAQIDGRVDDVVSLGDLEAKLKAFGWTVIPVEGNQMPEVLHGLEEARAQTGNGRPVAIILRTQMGYGVDFMLDRYGWHGKPPTPDQLEEALSQLQVKGLKDF